jgi:hypothetical protein
MPLLALPRRQEFQVARLLELAQVVWGHCEHARLCSTSAEVSAIPKPGMQKAVQPEWHDCSESRTARAKPMQMKSRRTGAGL